MESLSSSDFILAETFRSFPSSSSFIFFEKLSEEKKRMNHSIRAEDRGRSLTHIFVFYFSSKLVRFYAMVALNPICELVGRCCNVLLVT